MEKARNLGLNQEEELLRLGKALASEARIEILKLLRGQEMNVNEIAEQLKIPSSSAAVHVRILEEAGLLDTELRPGIRGARKICSFRGGQVCIDLDSPGEQEQAEVISMPIGNYVDYHVEPTCGIVGPEGLIDEEDEPRCFYNPGRIEAQLLWFGSGYVEYRFPNASLQNRSLRRMELSAELCSETANYDMDCPSDITLWINGLEAGTWHCPSDFGGRRGKYSPQWWPVTKTQYGCLKTWSLREEGTYLDGTLVSPVKLADYRLAELPYISVRLGIRPEAEHRGGVNIFGETFGDYSQNILLKFFY
ncbi:MAG TPA: helix-turn-helix domain-containing protein [Candidatus Egerieimonas intestinavium]|uniref:Helix-turn-helix domain-containing protein n=1 Tax=Candidatus Egerieimonas intestinavium TaxID=2840777 RepID=A0A9D1ELM8_9FIRM|nr:helix-turn-helix domain-containing protein [Candidatus Egerieimonas intestinavium]